MLTPINEVESPIVSIDLPLPSYIEGRKLGVNVKFLERVCNIAAIGKLDINTRRTQDQVNFSIGDTGDSTSVLSAAKVAVASRVNSTLKGKLQGQSRNKTATWTHVEVTLNKTKLEEDLSASPKGIRDTDTLVRILNSNIREGIVKGAMPHLLSPDLGLPLIGGDIWPLVCSPYPILTERLYMIPAYWIFAKMITCMTPQVINKMHGSDVKGRLTISPAFFELERAAVLKIYEIIARNKFVQRIPDEICE